MSDLQCLLKEGWALVEDRQDKLAGYAFARIFLDHPGMRDLFPVTMDVHRSCLLGAVTTAIQTLGDQDKFSDYLRALGCRHRKYQVVGAALMEALRVVAGSEWSHRFLRVWHDAYDLMASTMLESAAQDSKSPAWWHATVVGHERRSRDIAVITVKPLGHLEFQAG